MVLVRQKSKVSRGFQFVNTKRQPLYTPQFNISQTHVTSVSNINRIPRGLAKIRYATTNVIWQLNKVPLRLGRNITCICELGTKRHLISLQRSRCKRQ